MKYRYTIVNEGVVEAENKAEAEAAAFESCDAGLGVFGVEIEPLTGEGDEDGTGRRMTRYMVNATVSFAAWVEVEADSSEDALEEARGLDLSSGWDFDPGTADFQFDVTPEVEVVT